mmetsp:Transcript_40755/g.46713  ORF Transcript_40755/g.46713 Transcript_40755/m.46713 type:complete len:80 (+) Transcript_40755:80-319(+)|eukprot:CAMPEP_0168328696 /NCGR_PEP_ID=MMETSP0213-20121227/6659_1 /TAXON_ID=151035 /ORGANISM="Euplotes harpa, Strain FSP1.4" /LENGTH=79 /DNA_ID=CAMNT_0008331865 /DNA_START=68 /DNA_END=307 /DNA_ORIENTATION=+
MKNDIVIEGNLQSVDAKLNIQLDDAEVKDNEKYPYLLSVKKMMIRGNTIRHISMSDHDVDTEAIQEMCLKEAEREKKIG